MKESPLDPEPEGGEGGRGAVNVTATGGRGGTTVNYGRGAYFSLADNKFEARKLSMEALADSLGRFVERPVVDMTELKGTYDLTLEFTPEEYRALLIRMALSAGVNLPPEAMKLMEGASDESLFKGLQTVGAQIGIAQSAAGSNGDRFGDEDSDRELVRPSLQQVPNAMMFGPGGHRHILLAVELVSHRRRLPGLVGLETPERLAGHRVGRHQRSAFLAEDHQPGCRAERAAPGFGRPRLRQVPDDLAGLDVDGFQNSLRLFAVRTALRPAQVFLARCHAPGSRLVYTLHFSNVCT